MTEPEGTELYGRIVTYDHGDDERNDLVRMVWSHTPFVVDFFTGSVDEERENSIRRWLHEKHGRECRPIHGRDGLWQFGSAVVNGWQWIGFKHKRDLEEFLNEWRSAK